MRIRGILLAAVLGSSMLCPPRAHGLDAHSLIARCAATAASHLRGLTAIRTACPGIDQAVASLNVATLLPADWAKKASPASLANLDSLVGRYAGQPSSTPPAASDLRAIALTLQEPVPPRSSWSSRWDRIEAWLRRRLAPVASLFKWVRSVPRWNAGLGTRWLLLAAAGILILLALGAFIFSRLQAADPTGARRRRSVDGKRRAARPRIGAGDGETDEGIDQAYALDQPASALRILIDALRQSRRIERDGSLTCREVLAHAAFDTQRQREGFARIAVLAEQQLFGPGGASLRTPDELRPSLLALRTQLLSAPASRSAVS
jgi:hypothetical protein